MSFGTAGLRALAWEQVTPYELLDSHSNFTRACSVYRNLDKPSVNKSVVIGYDVRKNSKQFAELAATAFIKKKASRSSSMKITFTRR
jgi:phosphomannomutase